MNPYLIISFVAFSTSINAQIRPDNEEDNFFVHYLSLNNEYGTTFKRDSSGDFSFKVNLDTNNTVFISKGYSNFRLYDRDNKLIVEGDLGGRKYIDFFKKFGKWIAYYPNGRTKWIGYYYAGMATGLWKYFYPNGQLNKSFTLALIETDSFSITRRVGLYEEYYENGNIKISGFFKAAIDTTIIQVYDFSIGNFKDTLARAPVSKPFGIWKYYKENGELERKEEHY